MQSNPSSEELARKLGKALDARGLRLSVAESCTGGLIGGAITTIPGSSAWFRGGVIAYDNDIKVRHLDVPQTVLEKHGAVSEQTVRAMAAGAADRMETECAVAVSGIAGPEGGTPEKPVGLVYIGLRCSGKTEVLRKVFTGDRRQVREATVITAMEGMLDLLGRC